MAVAVRAVIVEAHLFSGIAKLCAEDGRPLVLTRHADGFDDVELRQGTWLTCEVALPAPYVLRVRGCDDHPQHFPAPHVRPPDLGWLRVDDALRLSPPNSSFPPPKVVPVVWLSKWQVFELPSGSRHAWGRDEASGPGRVSSMLSEFHPRAAALRSVSGRTYKLVGPPRVDLDGKYVWLLWLSIQRVKLADVTSVTDQVWSAVRASAAALKRVS
jgi:hypothetical protein